MFLNFIYLFIQLGLSLKKILKSDLRSLSKSEFIQAISRYINQRANMASSDFSKFCVCGGKSEVIQRVPADHDDQIQVFIARAYCICVISSSKAINKKCCTPFRLHFLKHAVYSLTSLLQYVKSFMIYFDIVDLQGLKSEFEETKLEVKNIQSQWNEEVERLRENFNLFDFSFSHTVAFFEIGMISIILQSIYFPRTSSQRP